MTRASHWAARAACRRQHTTALFGTGAAQRQAKTICSGCPVRTDCLAEALDGRIEHGVWGGMTERERRDLLRRRPHITSWRALLEAAQDDHAQHVGTAGGAA